MGGIGAILDAEYDAKTVFGKVKERYYKAKTFTLKLSKKLNFLAEPWRNNGIFKHLRLLNYR